MNPIVVGHDRQSTHDVSLNAGGRMYGFMLDGGPRGIQEGASVATSILANRKGARFSDQNPNFSHVEQRTWIGGRGQENISEDAARFFDSKDCWTLSPNVLIPTLQWNFADSVRGSGKVYSQLPGNVKWASLVGGTKYLGRSFTTTATMSAKKLYLWLKKVGNPDNVTAGVYPLVSGTPNMAAPVKEKTITAASVTDVVSFFARFLFAEDGSLSTTTDYCVIVQSAGTPDAKNHWEVGYDATAAGLKSSDGSAWTATTDLGIYYRLTEADVNQTWLPFILEGVHYFVSKRRAGSSQIFMVGDRGKVASGSTTTLVCTGKSWPTNKWAGAYVRMNLGVTKGDTALIASNTADTLTFAAMDVAPAAADHFNIYQTPYLTEVSGTFGSVKSVAVVSDVAYFARGTESADLKILRFRYKQSDGTHETDVDGDAKADLVARGMDNGNLKIWRAENGPSSTKKVTVSRADPSYGDDLDFGDDITCDDKTWEITGMIFHNGSMHILKEDCVGYISNGKFVRLEVGLDRLAQSDNGRNPAAMDTYLWFPWSHSAERLSGGTLDDEGPWAGTGLPENRNGVIAWFEPIVGHMLAAMDAGSAGYSSVLAYNGFGNWTELLRGHNLGKRIRMVHWQANPDAYPYLWTEIGGDLIYQIFPKNNLNPIRDSGCRFMHEGVMEGSTSDLDVALLPKFFKEIGVNSENLGSTDGYKRIGVDYQDDEKVNTSSWIETRELAASPEESVEINQGNKRQIRWRLRLMTEDASTPPFVRAIVLSGYAKLPAKRVWTMRLKLSSLSRDRLGAPTPDPTEMYRWLWDQSKSAGGVYMRTIWENADGVWVIVEPPGLVRKMANTIQQWWSGTATVTLREA